MTELNRRDFVAATAASAALVVLGTSTDSIMAAEEKTTLDIGKPADFAVGALSDKFAKSDKVLVAHVGDKIYAMTAVCTHRKGTIGVKDDKFRCPSHNSIFSIEGKPISGPAKQSLVRYGISLNKEGNLIVDKSKTFDEAKWNDSEAFYAAKLT